MSGQQEESRDVGIMGRGDRPSIRGLLTSTLTRLSRRQKQGIMIAADSVLSLTTMWLAFSLRYEEFFVPETWQQVFVFVLGIALSIPIFVRFGMYRAIFRYSGFGATAAVARAVATYAALFSACVLLLSFPLVPRTVSFIQPVLFAWAALALRGIGGDFLVPELTRGSTAGTRERLLVFGAGASGIQTFFALRPSRQHNIVAFVDDDVSKQGRMISGVSVVGRQAAEEMIRDDRVDGLLLAMPTLSRPARNAIIDWLQPYGLHVRSIPSVAELATGRVSLSEIRELDIEDLLGRDMVPGDFERVGKIVADKVVAVTGAGGSIGSELCRQLLSQRPAALLLVEASEFALYSIHAELIATAVGMGSSTAILPLLCNARDSARLNRIFARWRPETVYHAAAYKHVPLVEFNIVEGVENNVFGTSTVAQAALSNGVGRFVLISTDKAVRPTNVMGASKRFSEIILQALAEREWVQFERTGATVPNNTVFTMVRFGNVLGSSGSVVPLFRAQIASGGPITLTHPEVTRYFMSIPEAAQLVLQASAIAKGGEVFLLDMGEPVRIIDLARRMIKLSGLSVRDADNVSGDIEILETGLRPGEKLYEELLIDSTAQPTEHSRVMKARERMFDWLDVRDALERLHDALARNDIPMILSILTQYVDGFAPSGPVVDLVETD